jgi:hypothetical protein
LLLTTMVWFSAKAAPARAVAAKMVEKCMVVGVFNLEGD